MKYEPLSAEALKAVKIGDYVIVRHRVSAMPNTIYPLEIEIRYGESQGLICAVSDIVGHEPREIRAGDKVRIIDTSVDASGGRQVYKVICVDGKWMFLKYAGYPPCVRHADDFEIVE